MTAAYAASVRPLIAVLATLNEQITTLQGQADASKAAGRQHPDPTCSPTYGPATTPRVASDHPQPAS